MPATAKPPAEGAPEPVDPQPAADTPQDDPVQDDQQNDPAQDNDVKAKFRQALERKNARHGGGEGGDGKDSAKLHGGAHGPAHQQRTFRRKSG